MRQLRKSAAAGLTVIWLLSAVAVGLVGFIGLIVFWMPLRFLIELVEPDMTGY